MKSDSHETWKCADPELEREIRCFPDGERSEFPRLLQVEQKAVGQERNLGLLTWRRHMNNYYIIVHFV